MYKPFARPHFDYGDVLFDQSNNESFQYQACLAITWTSKAHHARKCMTNLVLNHLNIGGEFEDYVCYIKQILKSINICTSLSQEVIINIIQDLFKTFHCRTDSLKYSIFLINM